MRTYYRIVEMKNNKPMSLFHGTNGTRVLPVGEWVLANKKIVNDGSCSTYYESGFHVLKSVDDAKKFFAKMFRRKENRIIVACSVAGLRRKKHSRHEVYLADKIKILSTDPL